ncbi:MAG: tetratricopeptide repeat protein [Deltaproteobacteria bacterium]|nr:tetratricopeptide repeat protein [Candidatus Anaeroferrophillacea bacterium]
MAVVTRWLREGAGIWLMLLALLPVVAGCLGRTAKQDELTSELRDDVYEEILLHFNNRQYERVREIIRMANEHGARDKRLHFLSGIMAWQERDFEAAKEAFREAIEIDPGYAEAFNNLGSIYLAEKDYPQAIASFKAALGNPLYLTPELALNNLGRASELMGNLYQAETWYRRAIDAKPGFPLAYINLGRLCSDAGRYEDALEAFNKAAVLAPERVDAWLQRGRAAHALGQYGLARSSWERVIAISPAGEPAAEARRCLDTLPEPPAPGAGVPASPDR